MRVYESINEDKPQFRGSTLRQMNKDKYDYMRRKASFEKRQKLIPQMYANPVKEHERIELEKARLELAQQKAELAATQAEIKNETDTAIYDLAKSARKRSAEDDAKITSLARSQMRRKKK